LVAISQADALLTRTARSGPAMASRLGAEKLGSPMQPPHRGMGVEQQPH
jgi:hypothetical protein